MLSLLVHSHTSSINNASLNTLPICIYDLFHTHDLNANSHLSKLSCTYSFCPLLQVLLSPVLTPNGHSVTLLHPYLCYPPYYPVLLPYLLSLPCGLLNLYSQNFSTPITL